MATDLDKLDALLADQEKRVRDAFALFVASVRSPTVMAQIMAHLEARDIEAALAIVDSYIARVADTIPRIALTVGEFTASELSEAIAEAAPEIVTAIGFDPSFPRAAEIVQSHRLDLVRDMTDKQRKATTQALARGLREGKGPIETARAFRDSIGLTPGQEQAVANHRASLINLDRTALTRERRNRRYDGQISRAIERGRPLTDRQIDIQVEAYRRNSLQDRAETLARTEGTQAVSEAREESVAQMIDQTGLDESRIEDIWNATRDLRTRDWHRSMNGQKVPRGVPFIDGLGNRLRYPGDPAAPPETRINCRCTKTFSIKPTP